MKKLLIYILLSGFFSLRAQDSLNEFYRFYDFSIIIDLPDLLHSNDSKIILCNTGLCDMENININFQKNKLYKINYKYSSDSNNTAYRHPIDTIKILLQNEQMDSLYSMTSNFFKIDSKNMSKYKIPPPPIIYDGIVALVTLDLGFRGNKYSIVIGYPEENKNFLDLHDYIKKIIKNAL
jgi:hypothetical protein